MTTGKLQELLLKMPGLNLPKRSGYVAWAELVEITGITPTVMGELVELGWIDPQKTQADEYLFRVRDVYRIQKLLRLCNDLEVTHQGGSIIVDLLERVEELEKEIEELKRLV